LKTNNVSNLFKYKINAMPEGKSLKGFIVVNRRLAGLNLSGEGNRFTSFSVRLTNKNRQFDVSVRLTTELPFRGGRDKIKV
jgi:hypothetical protein